ncbi:MAG TPA: CNNM domain-containing protein [Steroidobacteraceae bacterium]|nr:CNNM domain-containing protein [Steroidobacteraceae bacterium]
MNQASTPLLVLLLAGLLLVIAFSSGTEVAMLSVNRYRVRHRAEAGRTSAQVLERLLQRPDDWLGVNLVILAAASVFASQAATLIAQRTQLHFALAITGVVLTIIMIVLGELVPKIFAATHSEAVAMSCAHVYRALVVIARPVLWLTSRAAYSVLRIFGVVRGEHDTQPLSAQELRAVVAEAGPVPARHRQMLLSILDLEDVTVNDIMIPRQEIDGIDVAETWEDILMRLRQTPHTRLPVFDGDIDNLIGILHMKRVAQELARETLSRERLIEIARSREPYFVPEGTALTVQLGNFQRDRRRHAFVVNEYGDIEGLVTIEDILEEIVGEFTSNPATIAHKDVHAERPGVFIINGSATIRALNRALQWHLPTDGPKTINGLLLEQLETIPEPGTALRVGDYLFEVLQTADNAVRTVRVRPPPATAAERKPAPQ